MNTHNICFQEEKNMSQHTTKATIRLVQPVKTQISPSIHCLIRVFPDSMCLLQPPGYPRSDKQEPLSNWVAVQADLCLCWSHRFYRRFCHVLAHIMLLPPLIWSYKSGHVLSLTRPLQSSQYILEQ